MSFPMFSHECAECNFLGQGEVDGTPFDFYFCTVGERPTVIARCGDRGGEYSSGMNVPMPELERARELAFEQGYLKEMPRMHHEVAPGVTLEPLTEPQDLN